MRRKFKKVWEIRRDDIEAATGYDKRRISRDIKGGRLDPQNLGSLAEYVVRANPALLVDKP